MNTRIEDIKVRWAERILPEGSYLFAFNAPDDIGFLLAEVERLTAERDRLKLESKEDQDDWAVAQGNLDTVTAALDGWPVTGLTEGDRVRALRGAHDRLSQELVEARTVLAGVMARPDSMLKELAALAAAELQELRAAQNVILINRFDELQQAKDERNALQRQLDDVDAFALRLCETCPLPSVVNMAKELSEAQAELANAHLALAMANGMSKTVEAHILAFQAAVDADPEVKAAIGHGIQDVFAAPLRAQIKQWAQLNTLQYTGHADYVDGLNFTQLLKVANAIIEDLDDHIRIYRDNDQRVVAERVTAMKALFRGGES